MPEKGIPRLVEEDDAFEYAFVGDITDVPTSYSSNPPFFWLINTHSQGCVNGKCRHPPLPLHHRVRNRR
jgi:hypothetical protein